MTVKDLEVGKRERIYISQKSTESSCDHDESPCERDQRRRGEKNQRAGKWIFEEKASAERILHVETCISDEEDGDNRNKNELEKERDSLCSSKKEGWGKRYGFEMMKEMREEMYN